jgi:hypothetical protein
VAFEELHHIKKEKEESWNNEEGMAKESLVSQGKEYFKNGKW